MKRPLLAVALLYAGGIAAWDTAGAPAASPGPLAVLLAAGIALALAALLLPHARPWLLALLLPAAGAANLARHDTPVSPRDLRRIVTHDALLATVRGRLVETPSLREWQAEPGAAPVRRTLATLRIRSLQSGGQPPAAAEGTVVVSTPGELAPEFWGGREVEVQGVLQAPPGPSAPGQFDYRAFLRRQGIHFQLVTAGMQDWRRAPGPDPAPAPPLADRFTGWGRRLLARGLPEDQALRLLWAMTLGWKTALNQDNARPFMRAGTMHVFAISGLHVALIGGVLVLILRALRVPSDAAAWLVIPALWFYTHATGWQPSAIRATLMMSVVLAGGALRRPSDLLNSLSVAALLLLLWDPRQLFQAGFQLSFSVVLCLALGWPGAPSGSPPSPDTEVLPGGESRLHRFARQLPLLGRLLHDPLQPRELRPRWRRALDRPARALRQALLTSLTAWLGSIPLTAFYFNLLTPVSLLSNLLVVPLSSAALAANLASLSLGALLPRAAELFNHAAWACMHLMIQLSQWTATWPGAWTSVRSPSWAFFLLYYAALLSLLTGLFRHPRWGRWNAAGLAVLSALWAATAVLDRQVIRLTVLPAGGGQALCVEGAGPPLLLDCGDAHSASRLLVPFLRSRGLDQLDTLVLTHGDIRHVGGAEVLRQEVRLGHLAASPLPFRSAAYRGAQAEGTDRLLRRGDPLGPWTVLHPADDDRFAQADDGALVLHGTLHGTRVLLLPDLGKPGQGALLSRETNLQAHIVVSGLPAQGEPLAEALLDAVQPSLIVVVDALLPAPARAPARLRERLAARGIPILYTSDTGGLTLEVRKTGWRMRNAEGRILADGRPDPLTAAPASAGPRRGGPGG